MVQLNGIDHSTNTALLSISSDSDIENLPTTTLEGHNAGETFPPVRAGSFAYMTDGSGRKFVLDGESDEWKEES